MQKPSKKPGRYLLNAVIIVIFILSAVSVYQFSSSKIKKDDSYEVIEDELIVKFKSGRPSDNLSSIYKVKGPREIVRVEKIFKKKIGIEEELDNSYEEKLSSKIYKIKLSSKDNVKKISTRLSRDPNIEYAEPNFRMKVAKVTPNDTYYSLGYQWPLDTIKALDAWDIEKGSGSIVIAVIDTGIDWDHPDLDGHIWVNTADPINGVDDDLNGYIDDYRGWDFVDTTQPVYPGEDGTIEDNNPMDFFGHGTFCAGIIAAETNNSQGIAGTSWNSQIMSIRAGYTGADGQAYLENDDSAKAVSYAAELGADIINMSWGSPVYSIMLEDVMNYAENLGSLLIAASGNSNTSQVFYPAGFSSVMSVSATDQYDSKASFSNYGSWITVSAPGKDICSTNFNNSYGIGDGTSFAAPYACGVAALIKSQNPSWTPNEIWAKLVSSADNIDSVNWGYAGLLGAGRVNALNAVTRATLRLWGADRYDTAIDISKEMYSSGSTNVVLARGDNFPDALAGAGLADSQNAPLLITPKTSLDYDIENEIQRLNPSKVYILGGEGALSATVKSRVENIGFYTERVWGQTRFETCIEIMEKIYNKNSVTKVFIVTGMDFADALISTPAAYKESAPMLLSTSSSLPTSVKTYLSSLPNLNTIYIIGGYSAISSNVENELKAYGSVGRIYGINSYDTSTQVAQTFFSNPEKLVIARADDYPDALCGGPLAIKNDAPALLTSKNNLPTELQNYISSNFSFNPASSVIYILGGTGAISENVVNEIDDIVL